MNKIKFALNILVVSLFTVTLASSASAASRVFVSSSGNDANACSLAAPCRTFSKAITAVDAGGEIVAVDSGGYGSFTINKAVSVIAAPGVYAGISDPVSGVTINAGSSAVVVLRGLTLNASGSEAIGIKTPTVGALHVENCVINGWEYGIHFAPSNAAQLFVTDTALRNNSVIGILVDAEFGHSARATIDHCLVEKNSGGITISSIYYQDQAQATIRNVTAAGNLSAISIGGTGTQVNVESCMVVNNTFGLSSGYSGLMRVANTTVTGNTTGIFVDVASGAYMLSRTPASNTVEGNGTDDPFNGTYPAR